MEGVKQYTELLESADPSAIAVQLALWRANHTQYLANSRAIDALDLTVNVSGSRLAVLRALYCEPTKSMALSAISKAAFISPTMVTNLVDGLERGGLVKRVGSPDDRRVSIACLTEERRRGLRDDLAGHEPAHDGSVRRLHRRREADARQPPAAPVLAPAIGLLALLAGRHQTSKVCEPEYIDGFNAVYITQSIASTAC